MKSIDKDPKVAQRKRRSTNRRNVLEFIENVWFFSAFSFIAGVPFDFFFVFYF